MINTINNKVFRNANTAYEYLHDRIIQDGVDFADTKALFNVGFYITNPLDNRIINRERNWKQEYAEAEWQWYLSGNRNISELGKLYGKIPEIWKRMADTDGNVNSNYGWQWKRNDQIDWVVNLLRHSQTQDKLLYQYMTAKNTISIITIHHVHTLYSLQLYTVD